MGEQRIVVEKNSGEGEDVSGCCDLAEGTPVGAQYIQIYGEFSWE